MKTLEELSLSSTKFTASHSSCTSRCSDGALSPLWTAECRPRRPKTGPNYNSADSALMLKERTKCLRLIGHLYSHRFPPTLEILNMVHSLLDNYRSLLNRGRHGAARRRKAWHNTVSCRPCLRVSSQRADSFRPRRCRWPQCQLNNRR